MRPIIPHLFLSSTFVALLDACAINGAPAMVEPTIAGVSTACASRPAISAERPVQAAAEQSLERVVVSAAPESATSLVDRAWDKSREDDRAVAVALFELALTRPDSNMPVDRIHWSYGWAMFNLNDHACALAHFDLARKVAPERVRWVPSTFAVTYWQMGQRDIALRWYDEAARNEPACWIDARAAERCTRHWLRPERRALGELLTAWKRKRFAQAGE